MKHLYVTLDYSRFEVIPTGVTRTKLIIVKQLILFIIPQSIWLFEWTLFYLSIGVSACGCARQYEHHTILPHFLPFIYDFRID